LIINQESDKPFHRRIPRVRKFFFTVFYYVIGGDIVVVAESHSDESHLFGNSGGFSGVKFPISVISLFKCYRLIRRRVVVIVVVIVIVSVVENDSSSSVEVSSIRKC
jgi:hypothetical protein